MPKKTLKFGKTARGFALSEFVDANGEKCSLQKSSAIRGEGDALIWLGVDNADRTYKVLEPGRGWQERCLKDLHPGREILVPDRMHLSQKTVKALLPALQHFAKTGELPE